MADWVAVRVDELPTVMRTEQCTAEAKTTGQRCGNKPIPGASVCRYHGGAGAQVMRKAEAREAVRKLHNDAARPVLDPYRELAELAGTIREAVAHAGRQVNELSSIEYTTDGGTRGLRAAVKLWETLMARSHAVLSDMSRLGIAERHQVVEEATAAAFVTYVRAVFADPELALTPAQRRVCESVASRALRGVVVPGMVVDTTIVDTAMPSPGEGDGIGVS